jgi:hypothetical protein
MKKLAWIASIFVALIGVSKAMDEDLPSKLTITQETSFRIVDDLTIRHPLERYLKRAQDDKLYFYEEYSKEHNVDIKTLRGKNFQPREFWERPLTEIMNTLFPVIRKYKIFDIISFDPPMFCFRSEEDIKYDFRDDVSQNFSEIVECLFEDKAYQEINEWMKKQGLKPIGWYRYQESLHNYYGAKEPLKVHDPKARRLPLYEYFLPYLSR